MALYLLICFNIAFLRFLDPDLCFAYTHIRSYLPGLESASLKCKYHPGVDAIADCSNCNTPICGICSNFTDSAVLCDRCVDVALIAEFVDSQSKPANQTNPLLVTKDTPDAKPKKQTLEESLEKREKLHMTIVIVSFLFIAFRLYTTIGAASALTQQQIQGEEIVINRLNLCVMVFWEIAAQLQNNREPDASLACAETDDPNIISRIGDDIIITHPHPELLGYSEIFIRKSNPVPIFNL